MKILLKCTHLILGELPNTGWLLWQCNKWRLVAPILWSPKNELGFFGGRSTKNLTHFWTSRLENHNYVLKQVYRPGFHAYSEDGCRGTPFVSPFLHASRVVGSSELRSGALERGVSSPCVQLRHEPKSSEGTSSCCRLLSASSRR